MLASKGLITPWTQKVTSSLNAKSNCVVRKRSLIYVERGNTLMTYGPIHSHRKGSACECCLRFARTRLQPQRGRPSLGRAVRLVAAPSVSLPTGGAEHQASRGSLRADDSDYDQGAGRCRGQAAGL